MPPRERSSSSTGRARGPRGLVVGTALAAWALQPACGQERSHADPPVIEAQPSGALEFEGQQAWFEVRAKGNREITYQWKRDGVAIPGAADSHYLTPPTAAADDGAVYTVVVTNGGDASVESEGAQLGVFPPLDLRFQWVGSPVRGSAIEFVNILVGWTYQFTPGAGTPLTIPGSGDWFLSVMAAPYGMSITYEALPLAALSPSWASDPPGAVVTSLDLAEGAGAFALARAETSQRGSFTPVVQGSVAPGDLPALAAAEGAAGRVITAASFMSGQVSYASYGWTVSGSTVYEARVAVITFDAVASAAQALAGEGYVLTAAGAGNGGKDGYVLVGTRAQGQDAPRPIAIAPAWDTSLDGYAIVAELYSPDYQSFLIIGEQ